MTFQTTLPEFKKLYPSIQGQVAKAGESSYQFNSKSGAAVVATFLDDQLLSIQLRYTEQQLKELGGWDTLNKRLQTEVGEPDSADDHVARWAFDSADRIIMASGRNGGAAVVTITRKSRGRRTESSSGKTRRRPLTQMIHRSTHRSVSDEASRGGAEAAEEQKRKETLRDLRVWA